jgi:hypothetical protein
MNSWEDQDRFVMTMPAPRPGMFPSVTALFAAIGKFSVMSAICWFFVWAAVGGWRTFHHWIDLLMAVWK